MKKSWILLALFFSFFFISSYAETSDLWRVEAENISGASHAIMIDNNGDASAYPIGVGIDQSASYVLYYENIPASRAISVTYATPHKGSVFFAYESGSSYVNIGSVAFSATSGWAFHSGVKTVSLSGISIPENATLRITANAPINIDYFTFSMTTKKTMDTIAVNIVPEPAKIAHEGMLGSGYVAELYPASIRTDEEALLGAVSAFSVYAKRLAGVSFTEGDAITLHFDTTLPQGGYRIVSKDKKIMVYGADEEGISAAMSTLCKTIQAANGGFLFLKGVITDYPDAQYRSIMIDVARKFHPVDYLFQYIDICYLNKLNCLQLHLSDTEGYRLPSYAYPKLTSTDGAYTRAELASLVRYAKDRGITIVPEIEVPGHCQHMQAKYPEVFGSIGIMCAEEHTFRAVQTLLEEVVELFPYSKYIHIGGDEANYHAYENCAGCNNAMKEYGINNYGTLYAYFVGRTAQMVLDMGRTPIAWEGFHKDNNGYIPKETIINCFELYYQTPDSLLAAGFTIINCAWNPNYIVTPKTSWSFAEIYQNPKTKFTPIYSGSPFYPGGYTAPEDAKILGAQICAWGDYLRLYDNAEQASYEEFSLVKPRATALAERLWNGKRARRTSTELYHVYTSYVEPREKAAAVSDTYVRVEGETAEGHFVKKETFAAIDSGMDTQTTLRYRLFYKNTPKATKLRINYGTLLPGKLLICLKENESYYNLSSVDFSVTSDWEVFSGYAETSTLFIPEGSEIAILCVSGSININYIDFVYDETRAIAPSDVGLSALLTPTVLLTDCAPSRISGSGSDAWTPRVRTTASGQTIGSFTNYIAMTTGYLQNSTYIEYDIEDTNASDFCALAFVEPSALPNGQTAKAIFTVFADGCPILVSEPVSAGDAPVTLRADIRGKKSIRLAVCPVGEFCSISCVWANPILARMPQYALDYAVNFRTTTVEAEEAVSGSNGVKINARGDYDQVNVQGMAIDGVGDYKLYYEGLPPVESVCVYFASAVSGVVFFDYFDEEKGVWNYVGGAACTKTDAWGWQNSKVGTAFLSGLSIPGNVKIRVRANFSVNIDKFEFISRHVAPMADMQLAKNTQSSITSMYEGTAMQLQITAKNAGEMQAFVVEKDKKYPVATAAFLQGTSFVYLPNLHIPEHAVLVLEASEDVSIREFAIVMAHENKPNWAIAISEKLLSIYKKAYTPQIACVFLASYDDNGRLVNIESWNTTLNQGEQSFPISIETKNAKAFLWTTAGEMIPVL